VPDAYENNNKIFCSQLRSQAQKQAIYLEMTDSIKNIIWNGLGISHAAEILHHTLIHYE